MRRLTKLAWTALWAATLCACPPRGGLEGPSSHDDKVDRVEEHYLGHYWCGHASLTSRSVHDVSATRIPCLTEISFVFHNNREQRVARPVPGSSPGPMVHQLENPGWPSYRRVSVKGNRGVDPWQLVLEAPTPERRYFLEPELHHWADPFLLVGRLEWKKANGHLVPHEHALVSAEEAYAQDKHYCGHLNARVYSVENPDEPFNPNRRLRKRDLLPGRSANASVELLCSPTHREVFGVELHDPDDQALHPRRPFVLAVDLEAHGTLHFRVHPGEDDNYTVINMVIPNEPEER
jgi:hypothetical protein